MSLRVAVPSSALSPGLGPQRSPGMAPMRSPQLAALDGRVLPNLLPLVPSSKQHSRSRTSSVDEGPKLAVRKLSENDTKALGSMVPPSKKVRICVGCAGAAMVDPVVF